MKNIRKFVAAAALAVGTLGMTAAPANAAVRIGVVVGAPVAYVPPCPGPGYVWVAGYWANGVWVPGYWNYVGPAPAVGLGVVVGGPVVRYAPAPYVRGHVVVRGYDHFRR